MRPSILDVLSTFFFSFLQISGTLTLERLIETEALVQADQQLNDRITRLLAQAVEQCGKPVAEIARLSKLKRDTLRRSLAGDRTISIGETVAILEAAGLRGEQALVLMLIAGEDFALARSGGRLAEFLDELFRRMPLEICSELGADVDELRPRWAVGTARLLARTLMQHVSELNRRGDAIGERLALPPT